MCTDTLEQNLSAEDPTGVGCELHQQAELGLGQMDLFAANPNHALVGDDLQIAEHHLWGIWLGGASSAKQCTNAS